MDIVQRLICVVLLLLAPMAHADTVPAAKYYEMQGGGSNQHKTSSPEATCQSYLANSTAWTYSSATPDAQYPSRPTFKCMGISKQVPTSAPAHVHTAQEGYTCDGIGGVIRYKDGLPSPALYPMVCIDVPACPEGQTRQSDGTCGVPPPPECEPGCNGACGSYKTFKGFRTLTCIDSCIYKLGAGLSVSLSTGETSVGHDVRENTGASCEGVDDSPATPTPCPECECQKQGKSWGTVNGLVVCHSLGTPGSQPVTKQDPPQTKTETPAPTPENPNPEPVTTETPSPVITITPSPGGGSPDITETTTNPDGSTTSTTQSQSSYCQKNPTASVCKQADEDKKKGSWSGTCGAFQCEGDAVNCAIARKIHQDRCDDLDELQQFAPAAEEGRRILMGEEDEAVTGFLSRDGEHTRTINLANEIKESGDYQFAAQCFSDVQINIGTQSITVPFSKLCSYFEMIGYILLAASYLWALRIVGIF